MTEAMSAFSYFAIALTLLIWRLACALQKKTGSMLLHPILMSVAAIILILLTLHIPNSVYQKGMSAFSWLLTPATVCLALPLYEQGKVLRKNLPAILTGVFCGTLTSLASALVIGKLFRTDAAMVISLMPKSVTTAIGTPVSEALGGIGSVTVVAIIITGIMGGILGPALCSLFRITDPVAQGTAIGTCSHVIGTTRANEMGAVQGAVGSLSLVAAGLMTAFIMPLICSGMLS